MPTTNPPLYVYLDQNMWIGLARCFYGFKDSAKHARLLDILQAATKVGKIILPLSGVHLMEVAAPEDQNRRERLARFMVDLSRGYFIAPLMAVRKLEVLQAVSRKLGCQPVTKIRDAAVKHGVPFGLGCDLKINGVPEGLKAELEALLASDEVMVRMLVDAIDRQSIKMTREEDENAAAQLEEIRRHAEQELSADQRHKVEVARMAQQLTPIIKECLDSLMIPMKVFTDTFKPDDWLTFFHSIPTIDVFVTLGLERDKQAGRPVHRNDLKDIGFLTMAVPYCNVVVCEKFFSHLVCSTGLDKKYDTLVMRSLDELNVWVEKLGG